jgi:hypothetical protein
MGVMGAAIDEMAKCVANYLVLEYRMEPGGRGNMKELWACAG